MGPETQENPFIPMGPFRAKPKFVLRALQSCLTMVWFLHLTLIPVYSMVWQWVWGRLATHQAFLFLSQKLHSSRTDQAGLASLSCLGPCTTHGE